MPKKYQEKFGNDEDEDGEELKRDLESSRINTRVLAEEMNAKIKELEKSVLKMAEGVEEVVLRTARIAAKELEEHRKHEAKAVMKEALKEWLDSKFVDLGKWSMGAFTAAVIGALAYFILAMNGWKKP